MKVTRFLVSLMLLCALPAMAMSDKQVIDYIKTQAAAGKSQDAIGKELLAKGVTPEQIRRIKAKYEKGQGSKATASGSVSGSRLRNQSADDTERMESETADVFVGDLDQTPGRRATAGDERTIRAAQNNRTAERQIFGHDVFDSREITFEPNSNMATPQNYRLGPGDEVIIDIWGASEDNIRSEISPDGSIIISQIGPVHLNGMTVAEANRHVKNIFARKYAGVGTETDVNLTLGNVRTIQVDVMGEVKTPGSYRLSPFSNVFHALYSAGGINDIASLRNIHVVRNGKKIANTDIYEYLFKGSQKGNIRLQEGDVIIVPPYSELVNVQGNVKRPMYYELKPEENLAKLIEYAGGFAGDAYSDVVRVQRQNGFENELYTIGKREYSSYRLQDGDLVSVGSIADRFSNKVDVNGAVVRPGTYALSDDIRTVKDLIRAAQGLDEDAYLDRALIYREKPDRSLEIVSVNIGALMNGTAPDIQLRKNDIIEIENVNELMRKGDLTINGYVNLPGEYPYAEGTTIEDLILQAGGLAEGASTARVDVARRIVDPNATESSSKISEVFRLSIENGMVSQEDKGFLLKPYDVVQIRKSPAYSPQESVTLNGEILFPGQYVLESRNERISDVVKRAGGLLESAYVAGAYLKRKLTDAQKGQLEESRRLTTQESLVGDSLKMTGNSLKGIDEMLTEGTYNVGINLQKAIENPGSTYDFVLQKGDELFVPEFQSTVQISGQVLFPNTVVYVPGKKLKYYIEQAGGYTQQAKKENAYLVYMNGSVAKAKGSTVIEPGSRIVVPEKKETHFDWTKVAAITSTLGSLAAVAATVVAVTK